MKKLNVIGISFVLAAVAAAVTITSAPSASAVGEGDSGQGTVALPPGGPLSIYPGSTVIGGANPYTPFGTNPYVPWGVWTP